MGLVLCYVRPPWAYFTSRPLAEQTGDDWHKKYYGTNSGEPDEDNPGEILKVAYDGGFESPYEKSMGAWGSTCPFSVDDINTGAAPWLLGRTSEGDAIPIPAGVETEEFARLIERGGGRVYYPADILGARE